MGKIGTKNGSGEITVYPTQYATGEVYDRGIDPTPAAYAISATAFAVLYPGIALTSDVIDTLEGLAGSTTSIGTYTALVDTFGLEGIAPIGFEDDFPGAALDTTNTWATDIGTNGTVAVPGNTGYTEVILTTSTTDDDFATIGTDGYSFIANATTTFVEARVRVSALTDVIFEIGFSDALSETNGIAFSSHDSTPVAVATDAALFGFHHDAGGEQLTALSALAVRNGTAQRVDAAVGLTANTWANLVVALVKNGSNVDASFFINEVRVADILNAVTASAVLYPFLTIKTLSTVSKTLKADYVRGYATR